MDIALTILTPVIWVLQTLLSIALWIVWQIVWIVLWLALPIAIVAYVAFRVAERTLGRDIARGWVKRQSMRLGGGVFEKLSRGLIASSVLPFRVIAWFFVFAVWHSMVSLLWTPRWKPWPRAWAKRWKPSSAHAARRSNASIAAAPRRA